MSDKTMFMLIFIVSTALLLYVEATDGENSIESLPECQENSDPYMATENCIQPAQEEFRSVY